MRSGLIVPLEVSTRKADGDALTRWTLKPARDGHHKTVDLIEAVTGLSREAASAYLNAAPISIRRYDGQGCLSSKRLPPTRLRNTVLDWNPRLHHKLGTRQHRGRWIGFFETGG